MTLKFGASAFAFGTFGFGLTGGSSPGFTITGTPPPATYGQPYSFTFTTTGGTGTEQTKIDDPQMAELAAHGFAYDGVTHTLSATEVTV